MAARKSFRSVVEAPAARQRRRSNKPAAKPSGAAKPTRVAKSTGEVKSSRVAESTGEEKPKGARRFMRFAGSSLICTVLDQVIAGVLFLALRKPMHDAGFLRILVSNVIARLFSQALNYALNHHLVFAPKKGSVHEGQHPSRRESLPRFFAVASLILTLSTIGVYLLHTFFDLQESVAKMLMDTALFFLNYFLQQRWVFKREVRINPKHLSR